MLMETVILWVFLCHHYGFNGFNCAVVFLLLPLGGASRSQLSLVTVKRSAMLHRQTAGAARDDVHDAGRWWATGRLLPVVPAQFDDWFPSCGLTTLH